MAKTIREELKQAFDKSDLTYEAFGNKVGISKSLAHKKLNGVVGIESNVELHLFAKVLGLKVSLKGAA